MTTHGAQASRAKSQPRKPLWSCWKWDRLATGLLLAAGAGAVFGHAWSAENTAWWWVGSVTLPAGLLLILSGVYARGQARPGVAPPLGELLVQKGWITEGQLGNALVRHYHAKQPLGQVLVEMKLITPSQLARALQEQLEHRQPPG
jgi:hypothetical protein